MFEASGSLALVQPIQTLLALVLLSFVWALLAALTARTRPYVGRAAAASGAVGVFGVAVALAVRLALLPRGSVLVQHVAPIARLGQLDLAFDLAFDPRSAVFAVVVALVGCASAVQTVGSTRPGANGRLAWTGLLTASAMLVVLGDGFAPILVGIGGLSVGAWGLSRGGDPVATVAALGGNVSILLGFVLLFWSLGGAFGPEGYDPDGAPRFVLVTTSTPSSDPEKAALVMTTHAGALVSSDDADLPNEPVAAPFTIAVPPGIYTLRVQGGAASADVVVPRVAFVPGRTHVLTPYGPTASLRTLDDQIAVPRLIPSGRATTVRAILSGRTAAGVRTSTLVLLLVLGGAIAHLHAFASRRGPSVPAVVLEVLPASWLAIRLAKTVDPLSADAALLVLLAAGSAVMLAARAACVDDGHKALRGALAATACAAVTAATVGDPSAAMTLSVAAMVSTSAAFAALEARRDLRWLGVACAGMAGVLPGAGTSPGYFLAISTAFGVATKASAAWAVCTGIVGLALVATSTVSALAVFRVYDAVIIAPRPMRAESRVEALVPVVLAACALLGGVALGAGTTMFGGSSAHLAARLIGPGAVVAPRPVALAAVVLSIAASAVGLALARRVHAGSAQPSWLLALGRPYARLGLAARGIARGAAFLQRSVAAMDRDVVEDVPAALGQLGLRVVRLVRRSSEHELPGPAEVEGSVMAERLRTAALLVMVALLGLVVLSSLLLG